MLMHTLPPCVVSILLFCFLHKTCETSDVSQRFTALPDDITCIHARQVLIAHLACFQITISTVGSACMQVHNKAFADLTADYISWHAAHPWDDQEWQAKVPQLVKQSARCEGGRHTQRCVKTFRLPRHQRQPYQVKCRETEMCFAVLELQDLSLTGPCVLKWRDSLWQSNSTTNIALTALQWLRRRA